MKKNKIPYKNIFIASALVVAGACFATVYNYKSPNYNSFPIKETRGESLNPFSFVVAQASQQRPNAPTVLVPSASGDVTYKSTDTVIDASNTSEGYIMVKYTGSCPKVKLQIAKKGNSTYTFDINSRSGYEVFPLSQGSGTYTINVYENVYGDQYALNLGKTINVDIKSSAKAFLYPNQYINFNKNSAAVTKASELAKNASSDLEVVANVYNYVIQNIKYDDYKASTVRSGYLPNVDNTLSTKKGICFDYASLMAAMLRSQNIPTKLIVGYTSGGIYHAWLSTYIDEIGWVDGIIYFDGQTWQRMDPTFASNANSSNEIMQFIGNGSNYSAKYVY